MNGILPDYAISAMVRLYGMIDPFIDHQVSRLPEEDQLGEKVVSYGLSAAGYDIRLAPSFIVAKPGFTLDVKNPNPELFFKIDSDFYLMSPGDFILASSIEYFKIPEDVMGFAVGKSTYRRVGLVWDTTPLEPGWEGNLTLELSNPTRHNIKIYANEGICQVVFQALAGRPDMPYNKRRNGLGGKYQGQIGATLPR